MSMLSAMQAPHHCAIGPDDIVVQLQNQRSRPPPSLSSPALLHNRLSEKRGFGNAERWSAWAMGTLLHSTCTAPDSKSAFP